MSYPGNVGDGFQYNRSVPSGLDQLDPKKHGSDNPIIHDNGPKNAGSPGNMAVGEKKPLNTRDVKFLSKTEVTTDNSKGQPLLETARAKLTQADKPTTAQAPPNKDLASLIARVDPSGSAQAFPNLVKQFAQIASIMAIAHGGGGSSTAPTSSQQITLSDAFSEALCILCNKTSFKQVMSILDTILINNGISRIDSGYQTIVKNGITNLLQKALIYGENKIPVIPDPVIVYGKNTPPVYLILADKFLVKDLAVKQYYSSNSDPYPGYITYLNSDKTYNFVKRSSTDYPYSSVDEECLALAQKGIANDMYPYIMKTVLDPLTNLPVIMTPEILSTILINHKIIHENNAINYSIGKGSSSNLMSNLLSILGIIGGIVNLAQTSFNSRTILGSEVLQALNDFSRDIAMAKKMTGLAQGALGGGGVSALAGLAGVSSLVGALNQAGVPIPTSALNGATSLTSIISSVASISNSINRLQSSGSSPSKIYSIASSQTYPTIASIVEIMRKAKFTEASITATVNVLRDIGLT